jgi:hypothetical protein
MCSGELWGLRLDGGKIMHHASLVIYTRGLNLGLHMLGEEGRDIGGFWDFWYLMGGWGLRSGHCENPSPPHSIIVTVS